MSPLRLSSTTGLLRSTLRSRPVRSLHSSSSSSSSTLRRRILVGSLLAAGTGTLLAYPGNKAHADEGGILPLSSASSLANKTEETTLSRTPLSSLLRTYLVYSFTSLPFIVDYSPQILSALTKSNIPGISGLTEWIVRKTFFDQFVGGDDSKSCIPVMETLRAEEIGVMLVYSVEVEEEHDPAHLPKDETLAMKEAAEARVRETLNCIKVAGDFERRMKARTGGLGFGGTWVAIKLTGLTADPTVLHRASTTLLRLRPQTLPTPAPHYPSTPSSMDSKILARPACYDSSTNASVQALENLPRGATGDGAVLEGEEGLREGDLGRLQGLWETLREVGEAARKEGIKVAVDAEHSWYQPAIDGYTMLLSQEFNKIPKHVEGVLTLQERSLPIFYGTYQAYLRRLPLHLEYSMKHADDNGYALGVKLVRGAYHHQERKKWADEGRGRFGKDPIWDDKPSTDKAYDDAVSTLISRLASDLKARPSATPSVGVYFGTHNMQSCDLVKDTLIKEGLGQVVEGGKVRLMEGVAGRVCTGQLYGMSDELTERVAETYERSGTPMASKYLPYGALREVLPYLGRRAIENKSLLSGEGGASAERKRVWAEIRRRVGF